MIERLKNCPNCAGTLNEAGSCRFCGSKVYDFLSIDFDADKKYHTAKTYIRIKIDGKIVLAPIIVNTVSMTSRPVYDDFVSFDGKHPYLKKLQTIETEIDINCNVVGNMYKFQEDENDDE